MTIETVSRPVSFRSNNVLEFNLRDVGDWGCILQECKMQDGGIHWSLGDLVETGSHQASKSVGIIKKRGT